MAAHQILLKPLHRAPYHVIYQAMQAFTAQRSSNTADEIWLIEHEPVYTLGQAGRWEHLLNPHAIPIEKTDRGGQVTYHGPGQLVIYPLLDLRRFRLNIRSLVSLLEKTVIDFLADYTIIAEARQDAPGVYVNGAKIASVGLRIRRGCCYHGIAFNVAMDLTPFSWINPCGFAKLPITQLIDLGVSCDLPQVAETIGPRLAEQLTALYLNH
jgi:lipoyl(octanoyl) transferase